MGLFRYDKKTFVKNTERFKQWLQSFLFSYNVENAHASEIYRLLLALDKASGDLRDTKSAKKLDDIIEGVLVDLDEAFAAKNAGKTTVNLQRLRELCEYRRVHTLPDEEDWALQNTTWDALAELENARNFKQSLENKRQELLTAIQNGAPNAEECQAVLKRIEEEMMDAEGRYTAYVGLYNKCLQTQQERKRLEFEKQLAEQRSFAQRLAGNKGENADSNKALCERITGTLDAFRKEAEWAKQKEMEEKDS